MGGVTFGGSILWGLSQWGQVVWNSPAPMFTAPDNRIFQVALSHEIFNEGHFGLEDGRKYGATVTATINKSARQTYQFRTTEARQCSWGCRCL